MQTVVAGATVGFGSGTGGAVPISTGRNDLADVGASAENFFRHAYLCWVDLVPTTDFQNHRVPVVALFDDLTLQLVRPHTTPLTLDDDMPFQTETSQVAQENFS